MSHDPNDTHDGRGALQQHVGSAVPSDILFHRVRASLEERRLVRPRARSARWALLSGLLAAGAVIGFTIGYWTRGTASPAANAAPSTAQRYVILLYGDPVDDTGAVHDAREREYGRWASSLGQASWVGGEELGDVVADLAPTAATPVRNDRLAGYFVIAAASAEKATAAARSVPHLAYGGRAVLMAVEP